MSASEYDAKYIDDVEADIPLTGPDSWERSEKLQKVKWAESHFESDINDGDEIPEDERETAHALAVSAYATYLLAVGVKSPDSMRAGDFADEGSQRTEFIDHLESIYERSKAALMGAEGDASSDDAEALPRRSPYIYTSR